MRRQQELLLSITKEMEKLQAKGTSHRIKKELKKELGSQGNRATTEEQERNKFPGENQTLIKYQNNEKKWKF